MDSTGTSATPSQPATPGLYDRKFATAGWLLGGVGTVIWAAKTNHKGKVWWFIGGSLVGTALGYLLDSVSSKNKTA